MLYVYGTCMLYGTCMAKSTVGTQLTRMGTWVTRLIIRGASKNIARRGTAPSTQRR